MTVRGGPRDRRSGRASIVDVAALARVNPSVVSRLLNQDPTLRIRPATRARVIAAVSELNYHPNASARALRTLRSGAIGVAVYNVSNPIFVDIVSGATAGATDAGYVVLLVDVSTLSQDLDRYKNLIYSSRLDGLLFQGTGLEDDVRLVELAVGHIPIVLLNWSLRPGIPAVLPNDTVGVHLAIEHLASLGHRTIGHITGAPGTDAAVRRLAAFEAALAAAGLKTRGDWTAVGSWDAATGRAAMRQLLAARTRPTAVFVDNVISGLGALREAVDEGVEIPDELSVVALHDSWVAEVVTPSLTTVKLPLFEMGRQAVKLILNPTDGVESGGPIVPEVAPELIPRRSTGPAPSRTTK